jgi:hypothetical protein
MAPAQTPAVPLTVFLLSLLSPAAAEAAGRSDLHPCSVAPGARWAKPELLCLGHLRVPSLHQPWDVAKEEQGRGTNDTRFFGTKSVSVPLQMSQECELLFNIGHLLLNLYLEISGT